MWDKADWFIAVIIAVVVLTFLALAAVGLATHAVVVRERAQSCAAVGGVWMRAPLPGTSSGAGCFRITATATYTVADSVPAWR